MEIRIIEHGIFRQKSQNFVPVLRNFHIDKIDDEDAGKIPKGTLTDNFGAGFPVEFGKMIFDGGAKALAAVAGGNCGVTSVFPSEYAAMADNPDIVAIAVTGTERSTSLPDVPTMQEQGIDATFFQLRSYCLPAGAPAEVVAFYGDIFEQVVNNADFQQEMVDGGFAPIAVAGSEASNKYMMDDFNANKDAVMAAAGVQ